MTAAGAPNRILNGLLELVEIHAQVAKDFHSNPFTLSDYPKQQVLRPDVVMTESERLLAAEANHILHAV
jgi:hypothetical protein